MATHMLKPMLTAHAPDPGTDLKYIQILPGHKSSKTTDVYTHVRTHNLQNIRSPFDDL